MIFKIRVLPALEDIERKRERESVAFKETGEQAVKVEKIMDMMEGLKEAQVEGGSSICSMDRGVKASLAEDGVLTKQEMIKETVLVQQGLVKRTYNAMANKRIFSVK